MLRQLGRDPKMRGMRFANTQDTSKLRRLLLKSMPPTLYSYLAALLLLVSCASQWGDRGGRARPTMCEHTRAFVAASSASQSSRESVGEQAQGSSAARINGCTPLLRQYISYRADCIAVSHRTRTVQVPGIATS